VPSHAGQAKGSTRIVKKTASPILNLAAWLARILPPELVRGLYRLRPLASLIRGLLNRSAPPGLSTVEVAAGGAQGMRMSLDLQSEKDYWLGTYEADLERAISDFACPGMVAYDVGANIGYTSLLLAKAVGEAGTVFAFEALPANIERLEQNLALNGLESRVEVVPSAVVDHLGLVNFLVGRSGSTGKAEGSAGRGQTQRGILEVAGISLDSFVYSDGRPAPEIVKMDIEGGEIRALPGMRRLLEERKPVLLLELHGYEAAKSAWEILKDCGYQLSRMEPGYPEIASYEELDWKAYLIASP
jgi:FkbM family methyltransferase